MKIISFTMVNNESEIIESFIRYNINFVDHMVIIDNGCTDNTIPIIHKMMEEGISVTLYDESLETYNQFRLDNKYLSKIIHEMQPDLIIPLDADEFLISENNPREELEKLALDKIYYVNWQWYVMCEQDNEKEPFIPKRLNYCLTKPAWNYSDGTPVTKTIIPVKYYEQMKLKLSMGHHSVFGNEKVVIENIENIRLAHYRIVSERQFVAKTCCYTIRDIATMENNYETAQRTNQMAEIVRGNDMIHTAIEMSYGGYTKDIAYCPIRLEHCEENTSIMRYRDLAEEELASRVRKTGQEMAIRAYNLERKKKERLFLKPIIFWLDGIRGEECIFPNPSNRLTILTGMVNARAYVTITEEIKFLKANYILIVTPLEMKFIPHDYVVVPDTSNFIEVKNMLQKKGISESKIISWKEYKGRLGIIGRIWCYIGFPRAVIDRIFVYMKRNGISHTVRKIRERLKAK